MKVNWVRLVLSVGLLLFVFSDASAVGDDMVGLFKLLFFLTSILMLGLAFELRR